MVKKEKYKKGKYIQKRNSSTRRLALIYSLTNSAWHAHFYKKKTDICTAMVKSQPNICI